MPWLSSGAGFLCTLESETGTKESLVGGCEVPEASDKVVEVKVDEESRGNSVGELGKSARLKLWAGGTSSPLRESTIESSTVSEQSRRVRW